MSYIQMFSTSIHEPGKLYILPARIIRFLNLGISECLGVTERMFWKY